MELINTTNQAAGTNYAVMEIANLPNLAIQYKVIADADNTVELQFWGTVYSEADDTVDDDWVDITEFLTDGDTLSIKNETATELLFIDSNCTLAKMKVKYIVTTTAPNNTIKVGWNTNS